MAKKKIARKAVTLSTRLSAVECSQDAVVEAVTNNDVMLARVVYRLGKAEGLERRLVDIERMVRVPDTTAIPGEPLLDYSARRDATVLAQSQTLSARIGRLEEDDDRRARSILRLERGYTELMELRARVDQLPRLNGDAERDAELNAVVLDLRLNGIEAKVDTLERAMSTLVRDIARRERPWYERLSAWCKQAWAGLPEEAQ